ncbi:MAG: MerR family transcriptional regulator [Myxococcales bacterium]|nr:MerR family transcriptional regulator [Myxococcales bacterium]
MAPTIPDKEHYKIGEVADLLGVKTHIVRYWDRQFAQLTPKKTRSRHRVFTRDDLALLFRIHELLVVRGFTIEGAKKELARGADDPALDSPRRADAVAPDRDEAPNAPDVEPAPTGPLPLEALWSHATTRRPAEMHDTAPDEERAAETAIDTERAADTEAAEGRGADAAPVVNEVSGIAAPTRAAATAVTDESDTIAEAIPDLEPMERARLQESSERLVSECERLDEECRRLDEECRRLDAENRRIDGENQELRKALLRSQESNARLQSQMGALEQQRGQLRREIDELFGQLNDIGASVTGGLRSIVGWLDDDDATRPRRPPKE